MLVVLIVKDNKQRLTLINIGKKNMELKINERKLKILGTVNIEEELEHGKEYQIAIEGAEMRGVSEEPNDDNTINRIFKLRISEMSKVNLLDEKGKLIKGKRKGSSSQELRRLIMQYYDEQLSGTEEYRDADHYYTEQMSIIINHWRSKIVR